MSSNTAPAKYLEEAARSTGQHCPFFVAGNPEEAFDYAVEAAGPQYNALSDVVVSRWGPCFGVEGTPIRLEQ
ncbi:MAG: hypothetical protein ACJARS_004261 [bacterium]|jgi:hypothetical protein